MAKKDKKNKKVRDDSWEEEVETAVPVDKTADAAPVEAEKEEETAPAPGPAAPTEATEDDFGGGGLLAALKKNQANKKKKGKKSAPTAVALDDEDATPDGSGTPADVASPFSHAPTEITEIDEDDFGPVKKGKKGGKQAPAVAAPAADSGTATPNNEEDGGRVKTKKEKEKEKKEREKQRKKEQAAKKKGTAPAAAPAAAAEAAPTEVAPAAATPAPAKPAAAAGGKPKKLTGALAALAKKQELLRLQEAERLRQEEEERKQAEEEERLIAEEEKRKEEAKARKKEKEREKKEQLKKEGKYMTPAQKEAAKRAELRLQQMRDAGMIVQALDAPDRPKKPVNDKKKKKGGAAEKAKAEAEAKAADEKRLKEEKERIEAEKQAKKAAEEAQKLKEAEEAAAKAKAEEGILESWEDAIGEDGDIKESWDDDSDDEKTAANGAEKDTKKPTGKEEDEDEDEDDDDDDDDDSDDSDEELTATQKQEAQRKAEAAKRREAKLEEAKAAASTDNLRSPICCILGHVDTGKTKLLDKIRQTNVQEGEAGGITQQIGATYFPTEAIKTKTAVVDPKGEMEFKTPGLLVIDTPGHESFTNLRSRGSSLCNIAILVVDIMHGLEPQTLESIRLLRDKKTPFIVALNKIDRLYGWNPIPNNGFQMSLAKQKKSVQNEFRDRLEKTKLAFAEQGLNSELYWENKSIAKFVSLVPTSAHTGEGIPDMLKLLVELTQQRMAGKLMYLSSLECTVLEVKVVEGLGTTIDVILSNGVLHEGDRIVVCGLNGAISTNIRALLTPQPMKEMRVKGQYVHHKEIKAAMGVKIAANDLEGAIAGSRLLVVGPDDDEEDLEEEIMGDLENLLSRVSTSGVGVAVQASTLGSLEALLEFLRVSKIPVSTISIGPVFKRDVMRAGVMLEKHKEYAVMLCFDVKIDKEATQYAEEVGVKIFSAEIIYHLFDNFTAHQKEMLEAQRLEAAAQAVFPCILNTVAVFMKKDPIVLGVDVVEGSLRMGTPIAAVKKNPLTGEMESVLLGRVTSIQLNHKNIPIAKKGSPSVAIKIEGPNQPTYGRHLDEKDVLYSQISRLTIDTLKKFYRDEVAKEDWHLLVNLKKVFNIT
ncbi:hypothetical protein BZA05DRAFT_57046 [Tricharina praecox]|uniref:uncharacterized protein n=1 Tax=Tricharina praecox TaxID=43433 RepID=UPI00221E557F|nr:uncharacterized protein BZA05DRAFT_57046 [Tricharina praecox]KAI5851037.1 hypothetical protein BZA05DRAFT_57046 [Tricharina praecox]